MGRFGASGAVAREGSGRGRYDQSFACGWAEGRTPGPRARARAVRDDGSAHRPVDLVRAAHQVGDARHCVQHEVHSPDALGRVPKADDRGLTSDPRHQQHGCQQIRRDHRCVRVNRALGSRGMARQFAIPWSRRTLHHSDRGRETRFIGSSQHLRRTDGTAGRSGVHWSCAVERPRARSIASSAKRGVRQHEPKVSAGPHEYDHDLLTSNAKSYTRDQAAVDATKHH